MSSPAFYLSACPRCSTRVGVERPLWRHAASTSRARGVDCYILTGCPHADQFDKLRIREVSELEKIEKDWTAEAARLLQEMSATWSDLNRSEFRRVLEGKIHNLPGATDDMNFTPDPPAQPEQHEPTTDI